MQEQTATILANLAPDITRSQFIILRQFSKEAKNSKEIGKSPSMDKNRGVVVGA